MCSSLGWARSPTWHRTASSTNKIPMKLFQLTSVPATVLTGQCYPARCYCYSNVSSRTQEIQAQGVRGICLGKAGKCKNWYKIQRDETYNGLMMMKPPWQKAVCYLGNTTERNKHSNFQDGQNKPLQVTVEDSVTLFLCLGFGRRYSMLVHLPWSPWAK